MEKTPLTGNAVVTGAAITGTVTAFIMLLRAYGYDVTPDQEAAWIQLLQGLPGDAAIFVVNLIVAVIVRSNVYSRLSVRELTGRTDPPVQPSAALRPNPTD